MSEHAHFQPHPGWIEMTHTESLPEIATIEEVEAFGLALAKLTPTERSILRARAAGLSLPEIAAAHFYTEHTIKNSTTRALHALGITTGNWAGRVPRATYLLGRVEAGERR